MVQNIVIADVQEIREPAEFSLGGLRGLLAVRLGQSRWWSVAADAVEACLLLLKSSEIRARLVDALLLGPEQEKGRGEDDGEDEGGYQCRDQTGRRI